MAESKEAIIKPGIPLTKPHNKLYCKSPHPIPLCAIILTSKKTKNRQTAPKKWFKKLLYDLSSIEEINKVIIHKNKTI